MRILIIPLPALAPTLGSQGRVKHLIAGFKEAGFDVATCAALDLNFKKQTDVPNYYLDVPIPMGMPGWLGKNFFQIAEKTGIAGKKAVHSFEEVLFLSGALSAHYFAQNIRCVQEAIQKYQPDIVYSEFNLGAIVAAKLEHAKILTNYSYPVQADYASTPRLAKGVNKVLKQLHRPQVHSSLELFDLADYKIIPSSYRLEPIDDSHAIFTGPFFAHSEEKSKEAGQQAKTQVKRNKLLAYMGTGTISEKCLLRELRHAFYESDYEVYMAGNGFKEEVDKNIHTAKWFDFSSLLPETAVMIHHGGQNSIMEALSFGVPQLICPGKVFERKYNAYSVAREGAGLIIEEGHFDSGHIREAVTQIVSAPCYGEKSREIGEELAGLGGVSRICSLIREWS